MLIEDLKKSRHDEHEGETGAKPSHAKYKFPDDAVKFVTSVDKYVEVVVSRILDQAFIFTLTLCTFFLLRLLFASHFDSRKSNEIKQQAHGYLLSRGIFLEVCALLLRLFDGCLHLCVVHYVYECLSMRAIYQFKAK